MQHHLGHEFVSIEAGVQFSPSSFEEVDQPVGVYVLDWRTSVCARSHDVETSVRQEFVMDSISTLCALVGGNAFTELQFPFRILEAMVGGPNNLQR